jgi:uncharacterized protein
MVKPSLERAFEQARHYALERLTNELPTTLYYHSVWHTRDEVASAAEDLAAREGVVGEALLLVRTAVYFHDIGFIVQRINHESVGAAIATQVLPNFGYGQAHVNLIRGMIMATQLPQTPRTLLEAIVADADLDVLGRADFWPRNQALRRELKKHGNTAIDVAWYSSQLRFLQNHRYFTASARVLRDTQKQKNIETLIEGLRNVRTWHQFGVGYCPSPALLC